MIEEFVLMLFTFLLVLTSIFFAYKYYKIISYATKEYEMARDFLNAIVLTFKKKLEIQNSKIDSILYDIENLYSITEKRKNETEIIQNKIITLTNQTTSSSLVSKKIVNNMILLTSNINNLKKTNTELLEKIELLQTDYSKPSLNLNNIQKRQSKSLFNLTNTEKQILQILISDGARTAPEIEKTIGKTREHTSRLMKKLWQNGYIERETQVSPFIYRPTKELARQLNKL